MLGKLYCTQSDYPHIYLLKEQGRWLSNEKTEWEDKITKGKERMDSKGKVRSGKQKVTDRVPKELEKNSAKIINGQKCTLRGLAYMLWEKM